METWMQPAREIDLQGITPTAVDGRRRSLGETAPSVSCGIPPRQALLKISRGPPLRSVGKHFWGDSREQSHNDEDDFDLATGNLDDALSLSELQSVYHLPSKDAARSLNVSLSRLKRSCRAHNLLRWPHRKLSSLRNLQETITNDKNMKLSDKQRILQQILNEIAAVRSNPDHTIDPRLDEIRQAKYKLKYYHKTKHVHASISTDARKRRHSSGCTERSHDFSHNGASAASAPTAAATVRVTGASDDVVPQPLSLSLPSMGPQTAGDDAPFAAAARPPAASTSLHTTANAPDWAIGTVAAVAHGGSSGGGSVEGRLAFSSPAAAPRFASCGAYSHCGGFSLYGPGSARCSVDGGGDGGSGGGRVHNHSSNPGGMSAATTLAGGALAAIPAPTAGPLSQPNAGTGRTAVPMWSFQPSPPPSASSAEVNFVLQQHHQEHQRQRQPHQPQERQLQQRHLYQHELLQWEQQQMQLAAVRRHSVGIMDETSGAVHPLPGMAAWGRQSATSQDGGPVLAPDGAGGGRGAEVSYMGSHTTQWTLPPPPPPAMAPSQTRNSSLTCFVQAPTSLPPASRGLAAGAGCGDGDGDGVPAMQLRKVSGIGDVDGSNKTFHVRPAAAHHLAVDLQQSSGPMSGFTAFGGHAAVGTIEGAHGSSNSAKSLMPYSHGVVNTSCPLPRCSSTGDPQVVAQLARQASASHPANTSTDCGDGGFNGGGGSGSGGAGGMYGSNAGALGSLHDGVIRDRFHSAEGIQVQEASGLPSRQSQTGGELSFQVATGAAASGASVGGRCGSGSGGGRGGRGGGTMVHFETCMGISAGHGAMAPSWSAPEAHIRSAPPRTAPGVPEPTASTAAPVSHGADILLTQIVEARLDQQQYQAQWSYQKNEQQQQQLEHVGQRGHFSRTQPLPFNMVSSMDTQLGTQYLHADMHPHQHQHQHQHQQQQQHQVQQQQQQQQQQHRPYFSSLNAARGYSDIATMGGPSQPPQRRGAAGSAAVIAGVPADAAFSASAFASSPLHTAAATGASFTTEVRFSSSNSTIATSGGAGRQGSTIGGGSSGADGGTSGSKFLSSARGSDGASGMPTSVATLGGLGLLLPSAAAASLPGRAITTGVPARLPSPAMRTPSGAAQYPFPGFADAMAYVGADWNNRGKSRGGGADGILSWQEPREVLDGIPPGQMPTPLPPQQQQSKQHMEEIQGQAQKEMQQQTSQFNYTKRMEPWGSLSFDRASAVTASSGAVEANASPGAGPTAAGAEVTAARLTGGGVNMGIEQAASGELGTAADGSGPAAAMLISLDWLLD